MGACASEPPAAPWVAIDPLPVHDWCAAGVVPELRPDGFASCSAVTRGDAERLATNAILIGENRE